MQSEENLSHLLLLALLHKINIFINIFCQIWRNRSEKHWHQLEWVHSELAPVPNSSHFTHHIVNLSHEMISLSSLPPISESVRHQTICVMCVVLHSTEYLYSVHIFIKISPPPSFGYLICALSSVFLQLSITGSPQLPPQPNTFLAHHKRIE